MISDNISHLARKICISVHKVAPLDSTKVTYIYIRSNIYIIYIYIFIYIISFIWFDYKASSVTAVSSSSSVTVKYSFNLLSATHYKCSVRDTSVLL